MRMPRTLVSLVAATLVSACGERARLPESAGFGPHPTLPAPARALVPTVRVAKAVGWRAGETPTPAPGTTVTRFADGLDHPRWLYVLPNGDVLVAETAAPEREGANGGIKGLVMARAMKRAGSATPSADRITLLRDSDRDGTPDMRTTFAEGLHSPFGMTLVGDDFYVANTDALLRFEYRPGATAVAGPGERVAELPAGEINHHWTKNVVAALESFSTLMTYSPRSVGRRNSERRCWSRGSTS